jgi:hypothetical protein
MILFNIGCENMTLPDIGTYTLIAVHAIAISILLYTHLSSEGVCDRFTEERLNRIEKAIYSLDI